MSTPVHSLVGRSLGNYLIGPMIGEGGMGAVFEGTHRFLGDQVAVKVLHGSYANDREITERFFQEARAGREIAHPNVVKILDFGQTDDGGLYLVMERLVGENLQERIARAEIGQKEALRIAIGIAEALVAAHAKGIVHRDLKPANLFLVGDSVKVLDFGIAKVLDATARTESGVLLGTPRYMAPEQTRGSRDVGPQSDVYSLGAILFEMITRQPPFDATNVTGLIAKALFEAPPRPSEFAPVSVDVEQIILDCLEKEPDARPQGMALLRERLVAASLADGPMAVRGGPRKPGAPESRPMSPSASMAPTLGTPEPGARTKTSPALLVGGLVGGLAFAGAIGLGGLWLLRAPPTPATTPTTSAAPVMAKAATATTAMPAPPLPILAVVQTPRADASKTPAPAATTAPVPAEANPKAPIADLAAATVSLRSTPAGATVLVDGRQVGTTPIELKLALPKRVMLTKRGYRSQTVSAKAGPMDVHLAPEPAAAPKKARSILD